MRELWGHELAKDQQRAALARFVHRFTGEHKPAWSRSTRPDGRPYPVQFRDDSDWLRHTLFHVRNDGALSAVHRSCESYPTWPDNPELRRRPTSAGDFETGPAIAETPTDA